MTQEQKEGTLCYFCKPKDQIVEPSSILYTCEKHSLGNNYKSWATWTWGEHWTEIHEERRRYFTRGLISGLALSLLITLMIVSFI